MGTSEQAMLLVGCKCFQISKANSGLENKDITFWRKEQLSYFLQLFINTSIHMYVFC